MNISDMGFFREYKLVNELIREKQGVVFYAESRHYYTYFSNLIDELLKNKIPVVYVTSDKRDPLLAQSSSERKVYYVKWMLGFLFSRLRANIMIMTMPDLGNFLFKRSTGVDNYIYMFHAAVSTHQQYREKAFFNYDTVFCTGDYQVQELRAAEQKHHQEGKALIPYGYPLFKRIADKNSSPGSRQPTILVAPSWFEGCIFDSCLEDLIRQLIKLPYQTLLRPHPEYKKRKKKEFEKIVHLAKADKKLIIDENADVIDSIVMSDLLVTDRSGIAFEFAFGVNKPVLFIDTPPKQVNKEWKELGIEPIENSWRHRLGQSLLPSELEKIPVTIKELELMTPDFSTQIKEWGKELFYAFPGADDRGINFILDFIKTAKL